jgi:catechol 2,3-dioxygenase-like lactoylglutathione lyase family enzyme
MRIRFFGLLLVAGVAALAQPPTPQQAAAHQLAHFHHLHFNSVDPAAAIHFYTTRFNGVEKKFSGQDAVWTGRGWFFFNKVSQPPPSDIVASLWHLGWGAHDVKAEYQHQLDMGTKFETPLGDLADLLGRGTAGRGYFAYAYGPDNALIELNGANNDSFQHIHMLSDDPVGTSEWYAKEFGIPMRGPAPSREARFNSHGLQVGPAVFMTMDNILFAWFPTGHARGLWPKLWAGRTKYESSQGRPIDHFAFSVDNLDETLARLEKDGVKVLQQPRTVMGGAMKSAFVQAPDNVRLELVETRESK